MEATNNGQTFRYSLPDKLTPSGGYTWASFKKANPHLQVAGLGGAEPPSDWIKATATAAGLVRCMGVTQFNATGAQKIAEQCLPIVKHEQKSEHGSNEWALLSWVKLEFQDVRKWFDGRYDGHSGEIARLHEGSRKLETSLVSKVDKDAMYEAFDRLIEEVEDLRSRVAQLTARLEDRREATDTVVPPPTPQPERRRRSWRDYFGF